MLKKISFTLIYLCLIGYSHTIIGQVGINTDTPSPDAMLDIESNGDKGLLIPRVDISNLSTIAPITSGATESLLVYNTNTTTGKGFYYWNGVDAWVNLTDFNVYTKDSSLTGSRDVWQDTYALQYSGDVGRNQLTIRRTENNTETGVAFRNSGNYYDASIYMESGSNSGLVIATGSNESDVDDVAETVVFNNDNTTEFKDQVGIGASSIASGAMLDVEATDKGFLPPRISLSSINDTSTISSNTTGMLVYNTNTSGSSASDVTPGYYYWVGSPTNEWKRFMTEGYSVIFKQTAQVRADADNTVYTILPGLDNTITAPVTGLYQIMATAYYAVEQPSGGDFRRAVNSSGSNLNVYTYQRNNSAGQGSIRLVQDGSTVLDEKYVVSYGMSFPDGQQFWAHGQSVNIIANVQLEAGTNYRFHIEGREWSSYKSTTQGLFGWTTSSHTGANGVADAQYGDMTITLINQY